MIERDLPSFAQRAMGIALMTVGGLAFTADLFLLISGSDSVTFESVAIAFMGFGSGVCMLYIDSLQEQMREMIEERKADLVSHFIDDTAVAVTAKRLAQASKETAISVNGRAVMAIEKAQAGETSGFLFVASHHEEDDGQPQIQAGVMNLDRATAQIFFEVSRDGDQDTTLSLAAIAERTKA